MVDGDGCRYVGVGVSLGQVISAQSSLRRIFVLILIGNVLPIFKYLACFVLIIDWKSVGNKIRQSYFRNNCLYFYL